VNNEIKEGEMGRACSIQGAEEKCIKALGDSQK
jgi:hypothetical protein